MRRAILLSSLLLGALVLTALLVGSRDPDVPEPAGMARGRSAERPPIAPGPLGRAEAAPTAPPPRAPRAAAAQAPEDTAGASGRLDSPLVLGAEAYNAGDWEAARQAFRALVDEHPDDPLAPYAAYQLAWSEANLGDLRAATTEMRRVVGWLRDDRRPEEDVTLSEALADLEHFQQELGVTP
ncbi:MAG: tetratricopeptide repeat protein [Deltaproteobacteria bacterium]|nr:tetratricopeptide repeat protein [Deltaproteobacteria bacterium]